MGLEGKGKNKVARV